MRRGLLAAALVVAAVPGTHAQDSTLVQDALYDRPFVRSAQRTSVGGYVEGDSGYFVEEGVADGLSMELRRFNVFLYSAVSRHVRFLSELEFERGTEEIALETALVDFMVDPALVIRAGVLLVPVGAFNQNHDGPLWEFVDRPGVSTRLLPATLSEMGVGVWGKFFGGPLTLTYDLYLTNGLGEGVVSNALGRTHVPGGKGGSLVSADGNGSPAVSGRLAVGRAGLGEIGFSLYSAVYNRFVEEGLRVDDRRRLTLFAVDFRARLGRADLRGEAAIARVDVQDDLEELFGERQAGMHLDVVVPILVGETGVVSAAVRFEALDFNRGRFRSTGGPIGDEVVALVAGVGFRPSPGTVVRVNFRRERARDVARNPWTHRGGFQAGFATYF